MRFLVQRVIGASVDIDGARFSGFEGPGLLVLCDTPAKADKLCAKLLKLRIFEDDRGAMNRSVLDVDGSILFISQFTLYADTASGNRPGFSTAARPEVAEPLYERCQAVLRATLGDRLGHGKFGAEMEVRLLNHGPATFLLEA